MPTIEQTAARIQFQNGQSQSAQMQSTVYDPRERLQRALLRLGVFWLLAVASVPIVLAHWVLVPSFLVAGPWVAWHTYHLARASNHVDGVCPACQAEVQIKLEAKDRLPKWSYCPSCNVPLQITAE